MTLTENTQKFTLVTTPNSRFLYQECAIPPMDWQQKMGEIDAFVMASSKLELANSYGLIYFFAAPSHLDCEICWVGREIIGIFRPEDENTDFQAFDLDAGRVLSSNITEEFFSWKILKKLYKSHRISVLNDISYLNANNQLAATWRLKIDRSKSGANHCKNDRWQIEFFTETDDG